jgi:hypothetical protein
MFAVWAEYEAKLIAERTHDGRRKRILGIGGRADKKPRLQGPPLYGYREVDGVPFEDEKEGPVARFMLRKALELTDNTSGKIAKAMNAEGYRTRHNKPWRDTTVSKLLRRAHCYGGVYKHRHGIEAAMKAHEEAVQIMGADAPALDLGAIETIEVEAYPPMITRDEANLILARSEKNRAERRGRPPKEYLLSTFLWCDVCGSRWCARRGLYYCRCVEAGRPRCGAIGSVAQHRIEPAVLDGMRDYLRRPEVHYALAMQDYNASNGPSSVSKEQIEKQVREALREQAHYDAQAIAFDVTDKQRALARAKSHELELKLAELKAELRRLSTLAPLPSEAGIVAAFGQMLDLLDQMATFQEKRRFIELTVGRIQTDGIQVKVTGTLDVDAVANAGSNGGCTKSIRHQAAGFRIDEARGWADDRIGRNSHAGVDTARADPRNVAVHVAGAVERQGSRFEERPVQLRLRDVRDAQWQSGIRRQERGERDRGGLGAGTGTA